MKTETVLITDIIFDPNNARKHSARNIETITASLKEFGQRKPIVLKDNVVIAGNGTLEAAKSLGWTHIDVTRVPADWDLTKAKAYALADNRTAELAEWDGGLLMSALTEVEASGYLNATGFNDAEMQDLIKLWGEVPSLDDLLDSVGDVTEEDGMERVTFKVPVDVADKWAQTIKAINGDSELEKICNVINNMFETYVDNA
jgi:ParB-like chromosome segregation protein Spo0J